MTVKLVRDRYVERIPAEALSRASDASVPQHLDRKLDEEIAELRESRYLDPGEYADILEILMESARRHGVSWGEVERTRLEKLRDRGGFSQGLLYDPDKDSTRR